MKKFLGIVILAFFISTNVFAVKFSHEVGEVVENEAYFGKKIKFPLPSGKFTVAVIHKKKEFRDVMLYQIDEKTGYVRWAVQLMATGRTQWEWWNPGDMCKRTNIYFYKNKLGNKKFACWIVNHTRTNIGANEGFWKEVRDYELANGIKHPDIMVYFRHNYAKGSKLYDMGYFYNPELDGVPKPESLEWDTNEFHMQRVMNYPKHEEFLKKFISVSASFIDRFNKLNKVTGSLTLDASSFITEASINTAEEKVSDNKQNVDKEIIKEIKTLKKLLDEGVITQEEFTKAKKKLLN